MSTEELSPYFDFISENTPLNTQHGVKGGPAGQHQVGHREQQRPVIAEKLPNHDRGIIIAPQRANAGLFPPPHRRSKASFILPLMP